MLARSERGSCRVGQENDEMEQAGKKRDNDVLYYLENSERMVKNRELRTWLTMWQV
jgi:hypothetical protein